jgi:hypothetical protein|tara:strand:+ start:4491 stop:8483 length:3993 start_codon:yes stop_codon:yes gene_type:complete
MTTKSQKNEPKDRTRRNAGGAATASGMNFQAAVTAIAGSHLLLGASLGWLDGLIEDIPTAIWAETGGPGDDIRIELRNGEVLEAQVKRGLSRGENLWEAVRALAAGLDEGTIQYGVLIVSSDTSKTIWTDLATDSRRLGEGRTDNLSDIGQEWLRRLTDAALPVEEVCARLRIHVVHASDADHISVMMTRAHLARIFATVSDADSVWFRLLHEAHAITERRGRWEQAGLAQMLAGMGVQPSAAATPASVASRVSCWVADSNQHFSLLGVKNSFSIDKAWLPLKACVVDPSQPEPTDPAAALARYHAGSGAPRSGWNKQKTLEAEWIGRFYTHAVVIGGPGMGKSTLMTRLAYLYARDGLPVLKVRLRDIAARLAAGNSFDDSVFQLGLDGSGVPFQQVRDSSLSDWVLLCDGLDECDVHQELVAARIRQFRAGNPRVRIIVTTRPIGYQTGELSEWRHYELIAPDAERGAENLGKLLQATSPMRAAEDSGWAFALATEQLEGNAAKSVISKSPQLIGMAASLLARGGTLGSSKTELYQNLFEVIDAEPNTRKALDDQPDSAVLARVFDIVGWELIADPLAKASDLLARTATHLRADLGVMPLKAQSIVNTALKYWQQIGLIEKVRHGTTTLITFVHKTFAEFAAARFIWTNHEATERKHFLSLCLDEYERWSEVVAFASAKMCEEVLQALLARAAQGDRHALERALGLLVTTPANVSDDTVQRLVQLSFAQVDADNTVVAYRFGLLLARLVTRFEPLIGALSSARLHSSQPWTQRVAWACEVEMAEFDIDTAQNKLQEFLASSCPSTSINSMRSISSLSLRRNPENELHESIALSIVRCRLADRSVDQLTALLELFTNQAFDTVGFNIKLSELAKKAGTELPHVRRNLSDDALTAMFSSDEYCQAHTRAMDAFLSSLATQNESVGNGTALDPPLQLSALFEITGWNESPVSDIWWAMTPADHEPMREVLRGIIALSAIHPGQLQLEAAAMCARTKHERADQEVWFLSHTVEVDVPELDWGRASSLGLDRTKLEHAALQKPQWLAISATRLLESLEPPDPARLADLLAKATGLGVFTACYLARQQGEIGLKLLLDRLDGPITSGFEHLIGTFAKTSTTWPQVANGLGKAMHASSARVAVAAASLTLKHVKSGDAAPESMLETAYQHWSAHEEPYPVSSGTVPDSPREMLLEAMNYLRPFPDDRIFELLNDTRRDVKDLALSWLIQHATRSSISRSKLVASVRGKVLHAESVARLLDSEIAFDKADISQLSDLFSDADPAYRLAALQLIKPHRMPNDLLTAKLKALMTDTNVDIGRTARTLWDTLKADGVVD